MVISFFKCLLYIVSACHQWLVSGGTKVVDPNNWSRITLPLFDWTRSICSSPRLYMLTREAHERSIWAFWVLAKTNWRWSWSEGMQRRKGLQVGANYWTIEVPYALGVSWRLILFFPGSNFSETVKWPGSPKSWSSKGGCLQWPPIAAPSILNGGCRKVKLEYLYCLHFDGNDDHFVTLTHVLKQYKSYSFSKTFKEIMWKVLDTLLGTRFCIRGEEILKQGIEPTTSWPQ